MNFVDGSLYAAIIAFSTAAFLLRFPGFFTPNLEGMRRADEDTEILVSVIGYRGLLMLNLCLWDIFSSPTAPISARVIAGIATYLGLFYVPPWIRP